MRIFIVAIAACVCLAPLAAAAPPARGKPAAARQAGRWDNPPALSQPAGTVVKVKMGDAADLQQKVRQAGSDTTVLIPAGTYKLTGPLRIGALGRVKNVALRGATGKRDDVVILGMGMANERGKETVPHCLMIEKAEDVLVADLTLGDVWFHPIIIQGAAGADRVHLCNCRLVDAGEQFVKSNPAKHDGAPDANGYSGASNCVVEYCVFEYTTTARSWYTEGIDVHAGHKWVVRHNLFRNIRGPAGASNVGGAIDFWNRSSDTLVECNTIVNCAVGIRLGIADKGSVNDHEGGIIRDNFIYRAQGACAWADVGIAVNASPKTQVLHNTVLLEDEYPNGIECRFAAARGIVIANNLTNKAIVQRDQSQVTERGNLTRAVKEWFVDAAVGDLHLTPRAAPALDKAQFLIDCPLDFDGDKRPQGPAADVGADELVPR